MDRIRSGSDESVKKRQSPTACAQQQAEEDRSTSHVLGAFGKFVPFGAYTVYRRFDAGVEQLDNQHQNDASSQ